ncbi:MAG TPA: hypothetical protein VMT37_07530 [Solirubrobacterales bacterium]|nr:hypothetical protein [Solirubrobacterales bacterium]
MIAAADPNRELTPALIRGSRGWVTPLRKVELAPGLEGQLCRHVFAEGAARRKSTIVLASIPEGIAFAPALVCRDRRELGAGTPAQLPTERWQPTELESTIFNRRYRLLSLAGQDAVYVREVFSPSLIAWLAHDVPEGFSFELNERHLVVALPGHLEGEEDLERLRALAAEVARRLREEAEEEGVASGLFDEAEKRAAIAAALTKVSFKQPPASVGAALEAFRHAARWRPTVVLSGLACALLGFFVGAAAGALFYGPLGAAAGLLTLSGGFALGREIAGYRYSWGPISAQRLALEAFIAEYARSHGLREVDRWRFHSDHRHLPLPGVAAHVMAGPIPGSALGGYFLTLGDAAELRSRGREIAYTTDRPLAAIAVVAELDDEAAAGRVASAAEDFPSPGPGKGFSLERDGATVAIWRPVRGSMLFTANGFDAFRAEAGELLAQVGEDGEDAAVAAVAVA